MSTRANMFLATRHYREVWNQGSLNAVDQICAPDIVFHDPASPPILSRDAYKDYVSAVREAFPDLEFTIHDLITSGRKVVVRWTFIGTHIGEIRGIQPTGKHVTFTGTSIYHFKDGRIKEAWISWDTYGYLRQLGAISTGRKAARA